MTGIVFDAGGLIAFEGRNRHVATLIEAALRERGRLIIPATALAQVTRNPAQQVSLWNLVRNKHTQVVPLDQTHAKAVGELLARTKTADVVDAHVMVCARNAGFAIITSDKDDLRRLDPRARLISI